MKILISACLLGINCKYDGGNNRNSWACSLAGRHELIPVCPECLGGLPVPRGSAEIVSGTVRLKDGTSVDAAFRKGAEAALKIARNEHAELVILQSRSPSCGVNVIYDGTFSGRKKAGSGVFAALMKSEGYRVLDIADAEKELSEL